MKRRSITQFFVLGMLCFFLMLSGCGGGGGGGTKEIVPDTYTGSTEQAVLTADNAATIVNGAWFGGRAGRDLGEVLPLAVTGGVGGEAIRAVESLSLARILGEAVQKVIPGVEISRQAVVTSSETVVGDCGGSADFTLTANDSTGEFSGQFIFNDFCSMGIVLSGMMPFSGKADLTFENIFLLELTFDDLDYVEGDVSLTFTKASVTYVLAADLGGESDTINLVLRDNTLQKTFWLRGYVIEIAYGVPDDTVTLTGRYYDHDYGFVDISTETPLAVGDNVIPTKGLLLFKGDNSQARLAFNPEGTTLLEVDGNNDGQFETSIPDALQL